MAASCVSAELATEPPVREGSSFVKLVRVLMLGRDADEASSDESGGARGGMQAGWSPCTPDEGDDACAQLLPENEPGECAGAGAGARVEPAVCGGWCVERVCRDCHRLDRASRSRASLRRSCRVSRGAADG